eukprot:gene17865-biopygen23380
MYLFGSAFQLGRTCVPPSRALRPTPVATVDRYLPPPPTQVGGRGVQVRIPNAPLTPRGRSRCVTPRAGRRCVQRRSRTLRKKGRSNGQGCHHICMIGVEGVANSGQPSRPASDAAPATAAHTF